jgi:hypothetical protein
MSQAWNNVQVALNLAAALPKGHRMTATVKNGKPQAGMKVTKLKKSVTSQAGGAA